jgi:hypothetical protein
MKSGERKGWQLDDIHPAAKLFIQHPLGNNQLIAAGKNYLHLMMAE